MYKSRMNYQNRACYYLVEAATSSRVRSTLLKMLKGILCVTIAIFVGVFAGHATSAEHMYEVVRVTPPPASVTVIGYEPLGVDEDVVRVNWLANVGFPETGLNNGVAPEGRPDAERLTV